MDNKNELTFEITPLISELFKTQAYIKTLASVILSPEQKDEFNELFSLKHKEVIIEFYNNFPDIFSDIEELKKKLGE